MRIFVHFGYTQKYNYARKSKLKMFEKIIGEVESYSFTGSTGRKMLYYILNYFNIKILKTDSFVETDAKMRTRFEKAK